MSHCGYINVNLDFYSYNIFFCQVKVCEMIGDIQEKGLENVVSSRLRVTNAIVKKLETNVITNLYKLNLKQNNVKWFQFEVSFEPELPADSRDLVKKIVKEIQQQIQKILGKFILRGNIIWAFKTTQDVLSFISKSDDKKLNHKFEYTVNLKKTISVNLNELVNGGPESQKVLQILGSQLKKCLGNIGMVEYGKSSKFYMNNQINNNIVSQSDLKVWRGYQTSIQFVNNSLYLLLDSSSRILRKSNLMMNMKNLNANQYDDFLGRTVVCTYGNHKTYKIEAIETRMTPLSKFMKDGKQITYKQYFKKTYNAEIKENNQPLIKSSISKKQIDKTGNLKKISNSLYLVPQLLNLQGITDQEATNRQLMKNISEYTKLSADQRIKNNKSIIAKIQNSPQNFSISKTSSTMKGYLLIQPIIKTTETIKPKNGLISIKSKLLDSMVLNDFIIIATYRNDTEYNQILDFIELLHSASKEFQIKLGKDFLIKPDNSKFQSFQKQIRYLVKKDGIPPMIITFLTNHESKFYPQLKRLLYTDLGVSHQNVRRSNFQKGERRKNLSIASKILLQINAKVGLPLWKVVRDHPDLVGKRIIVGGMAIYHKLINNSQSCEAFVGTTNNDFTCYYSSARLIPTNQQRLVSIQSMVIEWLRQYCVRDKTVPEYIILYRDGVGEGQINSILNIELTAIKTGIRKVAEKMELKQYNPGVALILCNKRINLRLFSGKDGQDDKGYINNPSSGTVFATDHNNFYLASQYVNSGTCTPTHYRIIYDTTNLPSQAFWYLTFEQCFNYYNWQGAVRVPAALMYANKLSMMIGENTKQQPKDKELSKKLYCL